MSTLVCIFHCDLYKRKTSWKIMSALACMTKWTNTRRSSMKRPMLDLPMVR
jgi:hypothetical protein